MINIGTNFGYQGDLFLDDRQGYPQTKNDLLNWSIPIPEGFEVCLDNVWYVYDSNINDPYTGHFKKRIDYDYPESDLEVIINDILSRIDQDPNKPLSFNSFNTTPAPDEEDGQITTLEVNSSPVNLSISWTLKRGEQIINPTNAKVNGSSTGVAPNLLSYGPNTIYSLNEPGSIPFLVKVWYNNDSIERLYTLEYKYKKYWGTSSSTNPTASEITSTFGQTWAGSWMMNTTIFNCSGGKYPYYVIPTIDYDPNNFTMLVNGLMNSDLIISDVLINSVSYKVIRTNNIQTGILRIKYEL